MADAASFDDLMARLRAGDQQAASEVHAQFAGRLIALARSRLDSRQQQILSLALQWDAHAVIAEQLACSVRTVRRALEKTRLVLEEFQRVSD